MNNDKKFIELIAHFIVQNREEKFVRKMRPYFIIFMLSSILCLFLKPGLFSLVLYSALVIITLITSIKEYIDAKKEANEKFEELLKTLGDNEEITQTEFLYKLWKEDI